MKPILTILALTAAVSLAACQSQNANNDDQKYANPFDHHVDASNPDSNPNLQRNSDNTIVDASSAYNLHNSHGSDKLVGINIAPEDRAFLVDASAAGNYEVEAGKLALDKSGTPRIKTIAQHMIDDHTKANGELMTLAKSNNVLLSTATNFDQQNLLNKLRGLDGSDFDREYISQQQTAHRDAIAKFETEANDSQNYNIREFAANTLPTLREHLKMLTGDSADTVGMK